MRPRSEPLEFPPHPLYVETQLPYGGPDLGARDNDGEEQRLLATIREARLLDAFTHLRCYWLCTAVRADVPGLGQVQTDELYVGVRGDGVRYVLPVQARAAGEALNLVRVGQDLLMCRAKFPDLVPRAIGAQLMEPDLIALLEFEETSDGIRVAAEKHYRLVTPEELTTEELTRYRARLA